MKNLFEDILIDITSVVDESAFNLRKDSRTSKVDFNDNEIDVEDINYLKIDYMQKCIDNILNDDISTEDIDKFTKCLKDFKHQTIYKVHSNEELHTLIQKCVKYLGTECDLNWIDVSQVENMNDIFCLSCFNGDISEWDVSNVKTMHQMFAHLTEFNSDISNWDVSNVEDMSLMFLGTNLNSDLSKWDVSNVKNMEQMFYFSNFTGDISNWDVSSVENMSEMFFKTKFNGDISRWDVSKVKKMDGMFNCSQFNGDISKWDVSSVEDMSFMFEESKFNGDISKWDVSNVKSMDDLFLDAKFNGDISKWNVNNVKNLSRVFTGSEIKPKFKPKKTRKILSEMQVEYLDKSFPVIDVSTFASLTDPNAFSNYLANNTELSNDDIFKCLVILMYHDINGDSKDGVFVTDMQVSGNVVNKQHNNVGTISHNTVLFTGLIVEEAICKHLEAARVILAKNYELFKNFTVNLSLDNNPIIDCTFVCNNSEYKIQIKALQTKNINNCANSPFKSGIDAGIIIFYKKAQDKLQLKGLRLLFQEQLYDKNGNIKIHLSNNKNSLHKLSLNAMKIYNSKDFKLGESLYADIYKALCDAVNEGEVGCDGPCGPGYNTLTNTMGVGDVVPAGMNSYGSGDKFDLLFKEPKKKKKKGKKIKLHGIATKQMLPQQK